MKNVEFRILKKPDRAIFEALDRIGKKAQSALSIEFTKIEVSFFIGEQIEVGAHIWAADEVLSAALEANARVVRRFRLVATPDLYVAVERDSNDRSTDKVTVVLERSKLKTTQALRLVSRIQAELGAVDLDIQLGGLVGSELGEYYDRREKELQRLEATIESFHTSVIEKYGDIQSQIERDVRQKKLRLDQDYEERIKHLDAKHDERLAALEAKKRALEQRESELDDRKSRHVRREIRQELKEIFRERNKNFTLTESTTGLREMVHWILGVMLVVTGVGLLVYTYASFYMLSDSPTTAELVAVSLRQLLFGGAFIAVASFWARWQSKWADRFAQEEFSLKRLELDIDRASWLVEMAMEWEVEKGSQIPEELISRLGSGLFSESSDQKEREESAADQVAKALFGSASHVNVDTAGARIELDRKARKQLQKEA